jgi:hypothetical protein
LNQRIGAVLLVEVAAGGDNFLKLHRRDRQARDDVTNPARSSIKEQSIYMLILNDRESFCKVLTNL